MKVIWSFTASKSYRDNLIYLKEKWSIKEIEFFIDQVDKTIELIGSVANISKEQQTGIIQINNAINILEKQVQANAEVSSQANSIAIKTSNIANTIVNNANQKEFEGKNSIK